MGFGAPRAAAWSYWHHQMWEYVGQQSDYLPEPGRSIAVVVGMNNCFLLRKGAAHVHISKKLSYAVVFAAVLLSPAKAELAVEVDKGVLMESNEEIWDKLLPKSDDTKIFSPRDMSAYRTDGPAVNQPKLPAEWANFTPTDVQNPSANFVGTLLIKDSEGKFSSTSE
ncbi:MAG: hypothetical protein LC642_00965, partial [Verrucomicrobiaceae bacterium]|nr:hypothetical protein [Verrucomicrobiaceae bacterium]